MLSRLIDAANKYATAAKLQQPRLEGDGTDRPWQKVFAADLSAIVEHAIKHASGPAAQKVIDADEAYANSCM